MAIGTNGNDTLTLYTSPATIIGLGGSDSLTTIVAGAPVLTNVQDGGAGFDTLTADMTATGPAVVSLTNAQSGGYGNDTITASLSGYTAGGDVSATSIILDKGGAGVVDVSVEATAGGFATGTESAESVVETGVASDTITSLVRSNDEVVNIVSSGRGNDTVIANSDLVDNAGDVFSNSARTEVTAGSGNDVVTAVSTRDSYFASSMGIRVDAGSGNDTVDAQIATSGRFGSDDRIELFGGGNNDDLKATIDGGGDGSGSAVVLINGGTGSDRMESNVTRGGEGGDIRVTLIGEGGNDEMIADSDIFGLPFHSTVRHEMDGGAGADTMTSTMYVRGDADYASTSGVAQLTGGFGADEIRSTIAVTGADAGFSPVMYGLNMIVGGGGADTLCADTGLGIYANSTYSTDLTNRIDGGNSNDVIRSSFFDTSDGAHELKGGTGNDVIGAIGGYDALILGESGNDTITSSATNSTIYGGGGSDVIDVDGSGVHALSGGGGVDRFHVDLSSNNGLIELTDFDRTAEFLCFEGVTDGDVLANGTLADEINALIVGFGNNGVDYTLQFASGTVLTFDGVSPTGADDDIASYVDDDVAQLWACTDLADPIC